MNKLECLGERKGFECSNCPYVEYCDDSHITNDQLDQALEEQAYEVGGEY